MLWMSGPLTICACAAALDEAGISYTPATGAIFIWVDMRKFLSEPTWQVISQRLLR